jgi:SSS family solute:Na+ symporter
MSQALSPIDLGIVVVYVIGTTLLGAWFTRRQKDTRTYFVGDRNVSWWLVLISIVATETSTVTFLSIPGVAYNPGDPSRGIAAGNLTFLQLAFGYVIGRTLIAWLLLPQYLRGELFSAYQLLKQRFNVAVQRTASGLFLVTRTLADGLRLFLTALLLQQFTGWDMRLSIVVMAALTILYTYLGGMEAVVWTDLIQFVIYILGAVWAGVCLLQMIPGGVEEYAGVAAQAGKFVLFDFSLDFSQAYTFWAGVIGGAFFSMASHGADQIMVQRYLCSRSLAQARFALIASGFVVLLQFLLFLLIGLGLYVFDQSVEPIEVARNDEAFGYFIVHYLPTGVVGLVVAAVLAAAMSTLSSSLNSSANALVSDFYRPLRPRQREQDYLLASRLLTIVFGVAQMGVALIAVSLHSERAVVDQVLSVAGFTTGLILGVFVLGSLRRPVSSEAALAGMVAGFAAVSAVWLPTTWGTTVVAWPWYAPIGTLTTIAVALLVDIFTHGRGSSPAASLPPSL